MACERRGCQDCGAAEGAVEFDLLVPALPGGQLIFLSHALCMRCLRRRANAAPRVPSFRDDWRRIPGGVWARCR